MKRNRDRPSEAVRRAIAESGASRYAIAKAAGLDEAALSRFMHAKAGLTLATVDALAGVLGLRIVAEGPVKLLPRGRIGRPPKTASGAPAKQARRKAKKKGR